MTDYDIINGVLAREGGWRDEVERPDGSVDPATNYGITLPTLRAWRENPRLPEIALKGLNPGEAGQIYHQRYVLDPGFIPANIPYEPLRIQLIDFGINSVPERAVRWLQRVLRLPEPRVDGRLGPITLALLHRLGAYDSDWGYWAINDALVAARSYMIDQAVDQGTIRRQDEEGLESRALSFFLARP